jgi:hypothetical protein
MAINGATYRHKSLKVDVLAWSAIGLIRISLLPSVITSKVSRFAQFDKRRSRIEVHGRQQPAQASVAESSVGLPPEREFSHAHRPDFYRRP